VEEEEKVGQRCDKTGSGKDRDDMNREGTVRRNKLLLSVMTTTAVLKLNTTVAHLSSS